MQALILIRFASHLRIVENKMPSLVHKENSRQRKSMYAVAETMESMLLQRPFCPLRVFGVPCVKSN